MTQENDISDEVNLLVYWKIILKRKWMLLSVFFVVTLATAIVSLILPKIYRGDFFIKIFNDDSADVYKTLKVNSHELKKNIFRQTNDLISDVKTTVFSDSLDRAAHLYKVYFLVEAKDTSHVSRIANEFIGYINNTPSQKKYIERQKELLESEIKECAASIAYISDVLKSHAEKINSESPCVSRAIEQKIELEKKRVSAEIALKNLTGSEIVMQEVYSTPVSPIVLSNIILSAVIGLLLGVLIVFFAEARDKIKGADRAN
jgi:capsular polysaccharide biosynthesis protein